MLLPTVDTARIRSSTLGLLLGGIGLTFAEPEPREWQVSMGGNAYLTERAENGRDGLGRREGRWREPESVWSVFFRIDRPAVLDLAVRLSVPEGESTIAATAAGRRFEVTARGSEISESPLGRIEVAERGYVRVDLRGVRRTGDDFGRLSELVVRSTTPELDPVFVKSDAGNMFYWGRRGPSVHLAYEMPSRFDVECAYSEVTVPDGGDPIGSFYMANGFGEGYFGIQTKSPTERWVLFSVWSPFATDDPKKIPESDRVVLLAKGEGVQVKDFGNEGSGGQSYLVYPWKTNATYRFLNSAKPDGEGNTVYTAWISEAPAGQWQLIARFRRPKTNRYLTGFHSFLENFSAENGHLSRSSRHANQWVRDTQGQWHEITQANFTGDATAHGRHRLDYAGGVEGDGFFLKNGGFFDEPVPLDTRFTRPATPDRQPVIDFDQLERGVR
ncbi:MAG: DUF3472 domain-containing protein [Verrucomicrobiales bacterium]